MLNIPCSPKNAKHDEFQWAPLHTKHRMQVAASDPASCFGMTISTGSRPEIKARPYQAYHGVSSSNNLHFWVMMRGEHFRSQGEKVNHEDDMNSQGIGNLPKLFILFSACGNTVRHKSQVAIANPNEQP